MPITTATNVVLDQVLVQLKAELPALMTAQGMTTIAVTSFAKRLSRSRLRFANVVPAVNVGAADSEDVPRGLGGANKGVVSNHLDVLIYGIVEHTDEETLADWVYGLGDLIEQALEKDVNLAAKITMPEPMRKSFDIPLDDQQSGLWRGAVLVRWRIMKNRVIGTQTI